MQLSRLPHLQQYFWRMFPDPAGPKITGPALNVTFGYWTLLVALSRSRAVAQFFSVNQFLKLVYAAWAELWKLQYLLHSQSLPIVWNTGTIYYWGNSQGNSPDPKANLHPGLEGQHILFLSSHSNTCTVIYFFIIFSSSQHRTCQWCKLSCMSVSSINLPVPFIKKMQLQIPYTEPQLSVSFSRCFYTSTMLVPVSDCADCSPLKLDQRALWLCDPLAGQCEIYRLCGLWRAFAGLQTSPWCQRKELSITNASPF